MPPKRRVAIRVFEPFRRKASQPWLRRAALCALEAAYPDTPCRLDITIADDATVRDLNARFRGLDEVTDVLSFSTRHPGHWEGDEAGAPALDTSDAFVTAPGRLEELGEVVISLPQVERQALAAGVQVERELALMVVHGVLHLLGHDHMEPDEQARMQSLERAGLSAFFDAPRPERRARVGAR